MAGTDETEGENGPAGTQAERLAFDSERERLPWLDADDDDDDTAGGDGARMFGFVLIGLVALAAIVGGIWWASHRMSGPALVADGSVIQPPAQPYKEAPKDPGGKTFDGTGDSAFAVSEGQTRPAKLGEGSAPTVSPAPQPGLIPVKPPLPTKAAAPLTAPAPAAKGPVVQVAAYTSRADAEAGWSRLAAQYSALSGLKHQIVEGQADIGTVYRLQVVPGETGGASALCSKLKAAGLACQVKG
jgi:SPOR domain